MNIYTEIQNKQSEEMNNFKGMFFAFNMDQFNKGYEREAKFKGEKYKVIRLKVGGGFVRKDRYEDLIAMLDRHEQELKQLRKDRKAFKDALIHELLNHEYAYSGDAESAVNALGESMETIDKKLLRECCDRAAALTY